MRGPGNEVENGGRLLGLFALLICELLFFESSVFAMNPDLAKERAGASFDVVELTDLLYGGRAVVERRHYLGEFSAWH